MIKLKDDLGAPILLTSKPQRIISLVPSLTETLVDAGLKNQLTGITKFCVHPNGLPKEIKIIGGTKNPRINDILNLKPDLVFANKEENRAEDINELKKFTQVYVTDIKNNQDILDFFHMLNVVFNTDACFELLQKLQNIPIYPQRKKIPTCYLIWKDPWMTIGKDTFIHSMMEKYGFQNICSDSDRYPIISFKQIKAHQTKIVMMSSEPYPFKEKEKEELLKLLPGMSVIMVDGEMFSWYGSRLLLADTYLNNLYFNLLKEVKF